MKLLASKGTDKGEHNLGRHRHVADPKAEGPLDQIGLCDFNLLVYPMDFTSESLVHEAEIFPKSLLHAVELFPKRLVDTAELFPKSLLHSPSWQISSS